MKQSLGRSSVLATIIKYVLSFWRPLFLRRKTFWTTFLPRMEMTCCLNWRITLVWRWENDFKLFSIGHSVHYDIWRRLQNSEMWLWYSGFLTIVHKKASLIIQQAPVIQKLDSAIHWINLKIKRDLPVSWGLIVILPSYRMLRDYMR